MGTVKFETDLGGVPVASAIEAELKFGVTNRFKFTEILILSPDLKVPPDGVAVTDLINSGVETFSPVVLNDGNPELNPVTPVKALTPL